MDLALGTILTAVAALPVAVVATAVGLDGGWPVLIRQRRIGRFGREFLMWKLRTMPRDTPQMAKAQLDHSQLQISPLGRFLRRHSIDELPQLLNVLTGEMSLVGPRPALYTQDDLIELRRLRGAFGLKPGLTGLAQVSGREDLTLEEKVALDAEYAAKMSPALDLQIILRTIATILKPRGSF
jgi:O-antigen biosynthesis protein WbqP